LGFSPISVIFQICPSCFRDLLHLFLFSFGLLFIFFSSYLTRERLGMVVRRDIGGGEARVWARVMRRPAAEACGDGGVICDDGAEHGGVSGDAGLEIREQFRAGLGVWVQRTDRVRAVASLGS
jgi:hypothetical protein